MMGYGGMGWGGMGWGGMVGMVLFWVVLIAAIVWAVTRLLPGRQRPTSGAGSALETPEDILDRRYARGEIDLETYQAQRAVLIAARNERLR
ncbi:MAG TPA: SHOCT domain-containing protein [Propionicimonas sp.]|jgi:putative membrane protein